MSHLGPPPPDPEQEPEHESGRPEQPPEPAPYNPYPDNWDTAPTGNPAFNAAPPPEPSASPYGDPHGGAYGGSTPYGAPPPPPGANPYAGPATSRPTFGFGGYAGWFTRVGAYLIDSVLTSIASAPLWAGEVMKFQNIHFVRDADGTVTMHNSGTPAGAGLLILIGALTGLAFLVWNAGIRQGSTGATIGKSVLAIRLVNADGQPIGPGWAILRQLLHFLDGLPCICLPLGYLWPIWDSQKQTFADKIMGSYVIQATTPEPRPFA